MEDPLGPFLFEDDLSPDRKAELRELLEDNPDLAEGWARWKRARHRIRHRLQEHLPDRRLLVLYALEEEGYGNILTSDERDALDAARDDISKAIEAVPALANVIEHIQDERADFEAVWAQHRGSESATTTAEREDRAPRQPSRTREEQTMRRWTWRLAVTALLIGAAVLAVFYGPGDPSRTTVTVADGEQRIVTLDDGSTVRLAGAASLSYPAEMTAEDSRRVTLERGQAYFDVTPRSETSFVVNTPTAKATVLGTQFGVTTESDTTEVVLVQGKVQVGPTDESEGDAVVLKPGEHSAVPSGHAPSSPKSVDLTRTLDWTGLFIFRSVPVENIAQRLRRYSGASISIAPTLADETVTGTFERDQPVSEILGTLARTLGAELKTEGDTYRLEPAS